MVEPVESAARVRSVVREARERGQRVGLVPTMGALHEGHVELIRLCRAHTEFVVAVIDFRQPNPVRRRRRFRPLSPTGHCRTSSNANPPGSTWSSPPALRRFTPTGRRRPTSRCPVSPISSKGPAAQGIFAASPRSFSSCSSWSDRIWRSSVKKISSNKSCIKPHGRRPPLPVELVVVPTVREPDGLAAQ